MEDQKLHHTSQITQRIYEDLLEQLGRALASIQEWEKKQFISTESANSPDVEASRNANNIWVERSGEEPPDLVVERVTAAEAKEKKESQRLADSVNGDLEIAVKKSAPTQGFRPDTGVLYRANSGKAMTDNLTKEDAAAVAAMLAGKAGENIPDAANLRITINGKVVAEADAYGNLIATNTSKQSQGLSQHFSTLATEDKRPSKLDGVEKMAEIASYNPNADGHQFMQQLANNFEALHSPDMPRVPEREGLTKPTLANASAIVNLYATKEPQEDFYKLKDGGSITSRTGTEDRSDYQFFEVRDEAGNVDMGFTVCPNGMILLDPKISSTLQSQISQMEKAWDRGLYDDDTPLMSLDKARADAVYSFQQNVTSPKLAKKSDLPLDVKTDRRGNIIATSKANPQAKIQLNKTKDGGFRIQTNSLTTPDLLEFNKAFATQANHKSANESDSSKPKTAKKPVAAKSKRNQLSM